MGLKAKEVGKIIRYATFFDLNAASDLEILINGTIVVPLARISTPNIEVSDSVLGILAAGTYMEFSTEADDFPSAGDHMICGRYTDGTPKVYYGDTATITVESSCFG